MAVAGWEDRYAANENGQIKSLKTGLILAQYVAPTGYCYVTREWICLGKRFRKRLAVHRLVWAAFHGNVAGSGYSTRQACNLFIW